MADPPPDEAKRQIPNPPPEEGGAEVSADSAAKKEDKQLSRGKTVEELEEEARQAEHARDQKFRDHFERLAIWSMNVMFATLFLFGVVWALHMILPEGCIRLEFWPFCNACIRRWLAPDQVTILQDIVTGGLIAGLLADHFRRRMGH